jgi:hypothetical protein
MALTANCAFAPDHRERQHQYALLTRQRRPQRPWHFCKNTLMEWKLPPWITSIAGNGLPRPRWLRDHSDEVIE